MEQFILTILTGASSGALYSFMGWAKSHQKNGDIQKLDLYALGKAITIGGIVGGTAVFYGISFDTQMEFFASSGLVFVIDTGLKMIKRRFLK